MAGVSTVSKCLADVSELGEEGNTYSPRESSKKRCRKWCFTLNNYTEDEMSQCLMRLKGVGVKDHIVAQEVGKDGTPHLQGYVEFKNQVRFDTLKNWSPRIHWEAAKGSREQNYKYCSKENRVMSSSMGIPKKQLVLEQYRDVNWRSWQENVISIVQSEPDARSVYWIWDQYGNTGKSFLAKFLFCKYDTIIASGKQADTFHAIKTWQEEHNDEDPEVIICDIPRSALGYVNYQALEKIKDGLFQSGKYEGGTVLFAKRAHVICFANAEPPTHELSEDRWKVVNID